MFAGDLLLFGKVQGSSLKDVLENFLNQGRPGSYGAILAYIEPEPSTDKLLSSIRTRIRDRYKIATTVGYGPRYLHSTGQLYKGDAGHGLFILITTEDKQDAHIPDELGSHNSSISFSILKQAEAQGDQQALLSRGRLVLRIHLADVERDLALLEEALT